MPTGFGTGSGVGVDRSRTELDRVVKRWVAERVEGESADLHERVLDAVEGPMLPRGLGMGRRQSGQDGPPPGDPPNHPPDQAP